MYPKTRKLWWCLYRPMKSKFEFTFFQIAYDVPQGTWQVSHIVGTRLNTREYATCSREWLRTEQKI